MSKPTDLRTPFVTEDGSLALHHFLPIAAALPAKRVGTVHFNANVAHHNAILAVSKAKDLLAQLPPESPIHADVAEMPTIGLALVQADTQVSGAASPSDVTAKLEVLRPLRAAALDCLELLADPLFALVPAGEVAAIRAGSGALDAARDGMALRALFEKYGHAIAGKHPFSAEQIRTLGETGSWLVANLKPEGVRSEGPGERDPASVACDQLAALLNIRYDRLLSAAIEDMGRNAAIRAFPGLGSRVSTPPAEPATGKPAVTAGGEGSQGGAGA